MYWSRSRETSVLQPMRGFGLQESKIQVLSGHDERAKTFPRSMSRLGRRCIRFMNRSGEDRWSLLRRGRPSIADELIDLATQIGRSSAAREAVGLLANHSLTISDLEMRRRSASTI